MWLFVPIQQKVAGFIGSLEDFPMREGMAPNSTGINYRSLKAMKVLEQLNTKGLVDRTLGD